MKLTEHLRVSLVQWIYIVMAAWWALIAMPFFGLCLASVEAGTEETSIGVALLDPAVWVFPVAFALAGTVFWALMFVLVWVTRWNRWAGAAMSATMTGLLLARGAHLRDEERRDREGHQWDPPWADR